MNGGMLIHELILQDFSMENHFLEISFVTRFLLSTSTLSTLVGRSINASPLSYWTGDNPRPAHTMPIQS